MTPDTVFKCLGDETRLLATLLIHCQKELCVCDLMAAMGESQPKISRHLAQLRSCGLLRDERRGQWVFYAIHPDLPEWVNEVLKSASRGQQVVLDKALATLDSSPRAQPCERTN